MAKGKKHHNKEPIERLKRLEVILDLDFEGQGLDLNELDLVKKFKPHLFSAFWAGYYFKENNPNK